MSPDHLPGEEPPVAAPGPGAIIEAELVGGPPLLLPVRFRGHPLVAWTVIGIIVALTVTLTLLGERLRAVDQLQSQPDRAARGLPIEDIEYRYLVGASLIMKGLGQERAFHEQARAFDHGPFARRVRFVVLSGEVKGPADALATLDQLRQSSDLPDRASEILDVLQVLYAGYQRGQFDPSLLSADQRELLRRELGWVGELALHPSGGPDPAARDALLRSARRTFLIVFGVAMAALLGGLLGLVALVGMAVAAWRGRLVSSQVLDSGTGAIYAETFAVWLVVFLFASAAAAVPAVAIPELPTGIKLGLIGAGQFFSLIALAWPVVRGIPWRQVRREIGLHLGERPWFELMLGFLCYLTAIPLALVGVVMTLLLMKLQTILSGTEAPVPSHPISEVLGRLQPWDLLPMLIVLSVAAPVVEETMFRGVLYRHLREATSRWHGLLSFVLSAGVVSLVFAAIHPQGLLGIPPLMGLAFAFTLAREWRGTLLPAMVAHGINNGIVFLVAIFVLGG